MRLRMEFSAKELAEWKRERDEVCKSYNVNKFRLWYAKWMQKGMYFKPLPVDDKVIEITMRKMVYNLKFATAEQKEEAKQWLLERGCDTRIN